MTAHRHTNILPLGSRPGKVERRRDVPRFNPTGLPGGAPTTRSAAKPRPSSLGPPAATRRSLFLTREAAQSSSDAPAHAGPPPAVAGPGPVHGRHRGCPVGPPRGPDGNRPRTVARRHASRCAGDPARRGGPHGDRRALVRLSGWQVRVPSQPSTPRARPRTLHQPLRDVVLPHAAVRAPRGGPAEGPELPAVLGVPPPLGTPINRCGPAGRMARHP